MLDIHALEGFEWDEHNADKNWQKHHISAGECEEAFFNRPLLVSEDAKHSLAEERYLLLGQANSGRRLFIAFTLRVERIRVISARDMSKSERQVYAKAPS